MNLYEEIAMNVWNDVIARPRNQHRGISYGHLERVVAQSIRQHNCDHYFPATETGYMPCEFCGKEKV